MFIANIQAGVEVTGLAEELFVIGHAKQVLGVNG